MRRRFPEGFTLLCLVIGAGVSVGCKQKSAEERLSPMASSPSASQPLPSKASPKPKGGFVEAKYADEVRKLSARIARASKDAPKRPTSSLARSRVAGLYLERAGLTSNYDDYKHAEEWLKKAFEKSAAGAGPFLLRAKLNFTLHRLPLVEKDLENAEKRILKNSHYKAGLAGMRGALAMQRGDYETALKLYKQAHDLHKGSPQHLSRLAIYYAETGDVEKARKYLRRAERSDHSRVHRSRAWYRLQLGLLELERGRYPEALAFYKEAAQRLQGYWLVDEHIAEVTARMGKADKALKLYQDIIARTNNPEFMDAAAGILEEKGQKEKAKALIAKADALFRERLKAFPEATYGHGLEHFLEYGKDPAFGLKLATANHKLRPSPHAAIYLAQAYVKAGKAEGAEKLLAEARKTPFGMAKLYEASAEVALARGKSAEANSHWKKALSINPKLGPLPEPSGGAPAAPSASAKPSAKP